MPFCNMTEDVSLSEPKKGLTSPPLRLTVSQFRTMFLMIHIVCCYGIERILACAASFLSDEMQQIYNPNRCLWLPIVHPRQKPIDAHAGLNICSC